MILAEMSLTIGRLACIHRRRDRWCIGIAADKQSSVCRF
jgi:hypothetical protein